MFCFFVADLRPVTTIAVSSSASLSNNEILCSETSLASRISSSQYKLSSASASTDLVLRQTPRESVRGTQRDNLHPLKSRYAPVDSKLRVRLLCSEAHPRVLIHEARIVWCGPEARAYPRHETTSSILNRTSDTRACPQRTDCAASPRVRWSSGRDQGK